MLCPRCKVELEYRVEIEFHDGSGRLVTYYYRCPRCGYRRSDLQVTIRRSNGLVVIEALEPFSP